GPQGRLGFAPRIHPENFRCAFTTAEGWGLYTQHRTTKSLTAAIDLRYGQATLKTLTFQTEPPAHHATAHLGPTLHPTPLTPQPLTTNAPQATLILKPPQPIPPARPLTITLP